MTREKDAGLWKIRTPYGIKNWAYIKRLMDQDTETVAVNAQDISLPDCGCGRTSRMEGDKLLVVWERCPLHKAAKELLAALKEFHQDEIAKNHYGDGPKGCSYCALIAKAEGR